MTSTETGRPATASGFQITGNAAQRYERAVAAFMLPWAGHLVDQAGLEPGERVVDLACGTGFVARRAAERIVPEGVVVGVDVNPTMVEEARRATGLAVRLAPADATGLPSGGFDAVVCQQGLQYFPDPAAALAEAARVLRPGGRLAVSVWADFDRNPFRAAQLEAMRPHLPPEAAAAFATTSSAALGGNDGIAALLTGAGLLAVEVDEHSIDMELPPLADYFPRLIGATPWGAIFDALTPAARRKVVDRVASALASSPGGGSIAPMTVCVATARRS